MIGDDSVPFPKTTLHCPYCGRSERFENVLTARAWANGHIHAEHRDELPDFEGTGGDA